MEERLDEYKNITLDNNFYLRIEFNISKDKFQAFLDKKEYRNTLEYINSISGFDKIKFGLPVKDCREDRDYNSLVIKTIPSESLNLINAKFDDLIALTKKLKLEKFITNIVWQIFDKNEEELFKYKFNKFMDEEVFDVNLI